MIYTRILLVLSVLFGSSSLIADIESHQNAAIKLMDLSGTKEVMESTQQQMIELQIQQNPMLAPYRSVLSNWSTTYLSYDALAPELAEIYMDYFSEEELNELIRFYETPVGSKVISTLPDVMYQTTQLGADIASQYTPELEKMIMAESQRIQTLQSN